MKLYKKEIGKLCVIKWKDAKGGIRCSLQDFIKSGFAINITVGWLKYFDKEKVITASECTVGDDDVFDLCLIPYDWIVEIRFVE